MGASFNVSIKEIISSHYDVHPYRDAFYKRNSPCYLLSISFVMVSLLTLLSGVLYASSSDEIDPGLSDNFLNNLGSLFKLNRTTILTDIKEIYPSDLKLSISINKITANKAFPICIKAPKFLMPLLKTPTDDELNKNNHASTNIDDIKIAHDNVEEDLFKKRAKDWLKAPSFFQNDHERLKQELEDDPLLDINIEEMWESIIGYKINPMCFIRIDSLSSKLLNNLDCSEKNVMSFISFHTIEIR